MNSQIQIIVIVLNKNVFIILSVHLALIKWPIIITHMMSEQMFGSLFIIRRIKMRKAEELELITSLFPYLFPTSKICEDIVCEFH